MTDVVDAELFQVEGMEVVWERKSKPGRLERCRRGVGEGVGEVWKWYGRRMRVTAPPKDLRQETLSATLER
jgi:hypothetical protein